MGLVILGILLVAGLFFMSTYNRLVTAKNLAQEGWSGIDVQLKRRADLIPNLIESVKGYMGHEKTVLEDVTNARANAQNAKTPEERGKAEGAVSAALANVFAVAENYPDLKASQNFMELQKALSDTEDQIQLSRRYYNGTARDLNIAIQSFPANIVAGMFHFTVMQYFEMENPADRAVPKVAF